MEYVRPSESVLGNNRPNLETLDAKVANSLQKVLAASFRTKVFIEKQNAQNENRFLRGRQVAFTIFDYFRITVG